MDLPLAEGKAALARLTADVPADSARTAPLGAFVEQVKTGRVRM